MKLVPNQPAPDFTAQTMEGTSFRLSSLKGNKILLSFFRNSACALCNLRVHELIKRSPAYKAKGLSIISVFESSSADILHYAGKQQPAFPLLADPTGILYELYGVDNSPEKIQQVMATGILQDRVKAAAAAGFELTQQEGANFFRIPADFLINEDLIIEQVFYESDKIIDHIPFSAIDDFANKH